MAETKRKSHNPELEDLSGPFNPDLKHEDFSKEFLLRLMEGWQWAWLQMTEAWMAAITKRCGPELANACETDAWGAMSRKVNPRYAELAGIELNTVVDSLKALQLPLDNTIHGLFKPEFEIKSPNHVIQTMKRCRSLEYFEAKCPERIHHVCHVTEPVLFKNYLINPKIKITPLKLPPRTSKDDICCQWELKIEE
ncbi:MAG: DUF6125 family protein [Dehalococcoidia bacterium]|nr:DUF6125 family protein [Dehalococcoidia bacterium]